MGARLGHVSIKPVSHYTLSGLSWGLANVSGHQQVGSVVGGGVGGLR